jgi:2-haloacid dehalogenase
MEKWADFDTVSRDALLATLHELRLAVPDDLDPLADAFAALPLVPDAADVVGRLRSAGVVTGILTNASTRTLDHVAGRLELPIDHRLSADRARRFKPHPSVYRLAVDATGLPPERIGFVTANGWDAAGAGAFGFRVVWLRSDPAAHLPAVGAPEPAIATWSEIPAIFGVTW